MNTYRRRPLTAEQQAKADARRAQFRELAERIAAMSDEQRAAMAERLAGAVTIEGHRLSAHNACLLACQAPDATLVGGFNQWRAHGRTVRKGEHGLMIWAPVRRPSEAPASEAPAASDLASDRPRFVMVTVFDVTQTEPLGSVVAVAS